MKDIISVEGDESDDSEESDSVRYADECGDAHNSQVSGTNGGASGKYVIVDIEERSGEKGKHRKGRKDRDSRKGEYLQSSEGV